MPYIEGPSLRDKLAKEGELLIVDAEPMAELLEISTCGEGRRR
jgi:hypothetical protein